MKNKYSYILQKNTEDNEIEYFWFCLKNYIKRIKLQYNNRMFDIEQIINNADELSKKLNILQSEDKINDICFEINSFVLAIMTSILKNELMNEIDLVMTQIKRWNKLKNNTYKIDYYTLSNNLTNKTIYAIYKIIQILRKHNSNKIILEKYFKNLASNICSGKIDVMLNNVGILCVKEKKFGILENLHNVINVYNMIDYHIFSKDDEYYKDFNSKRKMSIHKFINKYYHKIYFN